MLTKGDENTFNFNKIFSYPGLGRRLENELSDLSPGLVFTEGEERPAPDKLRNVGRGRLSVSAHSVSGTGASVKDLLMES